MPQLGKALSRIHAAGIVHNDLKLSNVLLNGQELKLIDFELAGFEGHPLKFAGGTPGYTKTSDGGACLVRKSADLYALGVCIGAALTGIDPSAMPEPRLGRLIGLLHAVHGHWAVPIILSATRADTDVGVTAQSISDRLVAENRYRTIHKHGERVPRVNLGKRRRWAERAAHEAAVATRDFLITDNTGTWWRNQHLNSGFACQGINIGAAGIVLGLLSVDEALDRRDFEADVLGAGEWLLRQPSMEACSGFFTGESGAALVLCILGLRFRRLDMLDRARDRFRNAVRGVLQADVRDLFAGSAGVVIVACALSKLLGETWPISDATPLVEGIITSARQMPDGSTAWFQVSALDDRQMDEPYSGAAHGSAGIALALALWGQHTKNELAGSFGIDRLRAIYHSLILPDMSSIRLSHEVNSSPAPLTSWCRGVEGYLWCLLSAAHEEVLRHEVDWAIKALAVTRPASNPTLCHGLAGQLELWQMASRIPRHRALAERRSMEIADILRLYSIRRTGHTIWCSEEPGTITPDLMVGFLGPAATLAKFCCGARESLFSDSWLQILAQAKS